MQRRDLFVSLATMPINAALCAALYASPSLPGAYPWLPIAAVGCILLEVAWLMHLLRKGGGA